MKTTITTAFAAFLLLLAAVHAVETASCPGICGDMNSDNIVDKADYSIIEELVDANKYKVCADLNEDSRVDSGDLNCLLMLIQSGDVSNECPCLHPDGEQGTGPEPRPVAVQPDYMELPLVHGYNLINLPGIGELKDGDCNSYTWYYYVRGEPELVPGSEFIQMLLDQGVVDSSSDLEPYLYEYLRLHSAFIDNPGPDCTLLFYPDRLTTFGELPDFETGLNYRPVIDGMAGMGIGGMITPECDTDVFYLWDRSAQQYRGFNLKTARTVPYTFTDYDIYKGVVVNCLGGDGPESDYDDSPFGLYDVGYMNPEGGWGGEDISSLKDLGVHWAVPKVVLFPYKWEEYMPGYYGKYYKGSGIQPVIDVMHIYDREDRTKGKYFIDLVEFYNGLKEAAEYVDYIQYWRLSDESDNGEIHFELPMFAIYTRMSYKALKDARSDAMLLSTGTSGGPGSYIGRGYYFEFLEYLDEMEKIEKGVLAYNYETNPYGLTDEELALLFAPDNYEKYFDGHHYSSFDKRLSYLNYHDNTKVELEAMNALFGRYGYDDIEYWITQTGTTTDTVTSDIGGVEGPPQSENEQANDLIRKYLYSTYVGVDRIMWITTYEMGAWVGNPESPFAKMGLIYNGLGKDDKGYGVKKLSYYSLKLMVDKLEGSDWGNVQEVYANDNVYAYKFINKETNKPTWVVWWDYFEDTGTTSKTVSLSSLGISGTVEVTEAVPHFENGLLLQNSGEVYPDFFDTETKPVSNGQVSLTLGERPVYIEPISNDLPDVPWSIFWMHVEDIPEFDQCFDDIIALADEYNTPLTLLLWSQIRDHILESPERLAKLREWQSNGHEFGIHAQYCCPDTPDGSCLSQGDAEKYEELVAPYELKTAHAIPSYPWEDADWRCTNLLPDSVIYKGAGRFDGRNSISFKYSVDGREFYELNLMAGYAGGYPRRVAQYNTLNSDELYSAGNHAECDTGELEQWFQFLSEKDPEGKKRKTQSWVMENVFIPEGRYIAEDEIFTSNDNRIKECSQLIGDKVFEANYAYSTTDIFNFGRCMNTGTYCLLEGECSEEYPGTYFSLTCPVRNINDLTGFRPVSEICKYVCGDGICFRGEDPSAYGYHPLACPQDCGVPYCGDGKCDEKELEKGNCPQDCGKTEDCGDGFCDKFSGETKLTCMEDCTDPIRPPPSPIIASVHVEGDLTSIESVGDLWMSTWDDNDELYMSWGDGTGFGEEYTDFGIAKIRGKLPQVTGENIYLDDLTCPVPTTICNRYDKPSSLLFIDGTLYGQFHAPLGDPDLGYLAYSEDNGRTWIKLEKNSPWTKQSDSNFRCMFFINMGKNYELNKDGYVYAFGIGKEWGWNGGIYLARVPKNDILDYGSYEYLSSYGETPRWSDSQDDAVPCPDIAIDEQVSAMYHPGVDRYLLLSSTGLYDAPNPWGPWTYAGTWIKRGYNGYQPGIISKNVGENYFWFTISSMEQDVGYNLNIGKMVMELKNQPSCGNGVCEHDEDEKNCPQDCETHDYHLECLAGNRCKKVDGLGQDQCSSDADCTKPVIGT